jgi:hypothetical protein
VVGGGSDGGRGQSGFCTSSSCERLHFTHTHTHTHLRPPGPPPTHNEIAPLTLPFLQCAFFGEWGKNPGWLLPPPPNTHSRTRESLWVHTATIQGYRSHTVTYITVSLYPTHSIFHAPPPSPPPHTHKAHLFLQADDVYLPPAIDALLGSSDK